MNTLTKDQKRKAKEIISAGLTKAAESLSFFMNEKIVGWTARAMNGDKPKFISEQQPGYVFNLDNQTYDKKFVVVCEGPFDAISIDGCALLGAEIKDQQDWLLKRLEKEII